jgi:hypothetical protein
MSNQISVLLDIPSFEDLGLQVFPNPTDGQLQIVNQNRIALQDLRLTDAHGRNVDFTLNRAGTRWTVEWEGAAGVYWLSIDSDGRTARTQVIKVD